MVVGSDSTRVECLVEGPVQAGVFVLAPEREREKRGFLRSLAAMYVDLDLTDSSN